MLPASIQQSYRSRGIWRRETIPERFSRVVGESEDRVAFVDGSRAVTFTEADAMVERLAAHLTRLGVRRGDVVAWQLPNWWEAAVVHHAILRIGALPNPLNMIFRARELRFVLAEAKPKVLFVPGAFRRFDHGSLGRRMRDEIASLEHVIVVRGSGLSTLDELLESKAAGTWLGGAPADPALLLYTSGTTSDPKGVLHSHETLLYELSSLAGVHAITPDDRYLGGSPFTHIAGLVYGVLMPFALGTSTVALERWTASHAIDAIEQDGATFMTGAPTFLQTLAADSRASRVRGSRFRLFSTGGSAISTDAVHAAEAALGCTVKRAYGSTEVPTLTATAFDDPIEVRLGTDGRAIGPAEIKIVDGEIWARAPELFLGYRNPALNDCFDSEGWYRTGDLGTLDDAGVLRVTGRLKDIIIRGGENISAAEVEALLTSHASVSEAAVVGVADPLLGERACAFVVVARGSSFTFEDMTAHFDQLSVAKQKYPERLEIVKRLPKTSSGKIAKAELRSAIARN